jgi:hypothetical protein
MTRSSRRARGAALLGLLVLSWPARASAVEPVAASLCQTDEKTVMACGLKTRQAVLCASPASAPFDSLSYRYGRPGRVELEHRVRRGDATVFGATVSPANPRALVHQVWFNRGSTRYVLTECVGGDCAHRAGLLVLGRRGVISRRACDTAQGQQPAFARDVVQFGSDLGDSRSSTELLRFEDTDNSIEALYPARRVY